MGDILEYQKDRIWLKEYPIKYAGTRFNARMTLVRLKNGNLLIHSPCQVDERLKNKIRGLGDVQFIAAPGYYHYFYVRSAQQAFPGAETLICPGIEKKLPALKFDWILGNRPDPRLEEDFDQVLVRGNKYIWEVVFYHLQTRTLILVDLIENFTRRSTDINWTLKFWWKFVFHMWENPKPAPEYQLGWKDRAAARDSIETILKWDFNRIILSHGDLIEENAKESAKKAWRKLLES